MKKRFGVALCFSSVLLAAIFAFYPAANSRQAKTGDARLSHVPVFVELFTSEGCSSCPPADALLTKLQEQQPVSGVEIIGLEEHVDYWDQQGWVDPFSSEQWTERQQKYAAARRDDGVYTPQMVIDGRAQFVGSREREARQEIAQAATRARAEVSLTPQNAAKHDTAQFQISVGKLTDPTPGNTIDVWLGLTEIGLHSSVTRGENAGENLHHAPVLRELRKIGAAESGKVPSFTADGVLKLDHSWNRQNLRAVVFVQENRTRYILGSAAARIEP